MLGIKRRRQHRFIPTHVGNSLSDRWAIPRLTVHPHARGEQLLAALVTEQGTGSSPRTWGTGLQAHPTMSHRRFIPTHVGNRRILFPMTYAESVHPHARGEQGAMPTSTTWAGGSSPRTWGTGVLDLLQRPQRRFIPTHVGNSGCSTRPGASASVHPHARGEQKSARM